MKRATKLLVLSAFVLLSSAAAARAEDDRQVWRDTEGEIVHNSWGTCVRSIWVIDYDPCASKAEMAALPPRKRAVIAEEQRTVYFPFDKSGLTDQARQLLDALAGKLTADDDVQGAVIVGYADRIGTVSYNERLSERRAETVRDYLTQRGFLKPDMTETRWVGKSKPSVECGDGLPRPELLQCLQPDRKVTVEIHYRAETENQPAAPPPAQPAARPQSDDDDMVDD